MQRHRVMLEWGRRVSDILRRTTCLSKTSHSPSPLGGYPFLLQVAKVNSANDGTLVLRCGHWGLPVVQRECM